MCLRCLILTGTKTTEFTAKILKWQVLHPNAEVRPFYATGTNIWIPTLSIIYSLYTQELFICSQIKNLLSK
jgi:hypothetical protein